MGQMKKNTVWVAVVQTKYEAWAVADTEDKARRAATEKAMEYLAQVGCLNGRTAEEVVDDLGINTYELVLNGDGEIF